MPGAVTTNRFYVIHHPTGKQLAYWTVEESLRSLWPVEEISYRDIAKRRGLNVLQSAKVQIIKEKELLALKETNNG